MAGADSWVVAADLRAAAITVADFMGMAADFTGTARASILVWAGPITILTLTDIRATPPAATMTHTETGLPAPARRHPTITDIEFSQTIGRQSRKIEKL